MTYEGGKGNVLVKLVVPNETISKIFFENER